MTSNGLRKSLLKSAALLVVISLLVYLTAVSPDGSLWASLGTLFMAMFRTIQLSLGLVISLLFCLLVLIGIFLGCVAMVSRESAANMLEQLRRMISDKLLWVRALVVRDMPSRGTRLLKEYGENLKQEIREEMDGSLTQLRVEQNSAMEQINGITQRVETIVNRMDNESISNQVEEQGKAFRELQEVLQSVQEQTIQLQANLNELASQIDNGDIVRSVEELSRQVNELQVANASLQTEFSEVKKVKFYLSGKTFE